jgi:hypothetical protein
MTQIGRPRLSALKRAIPRIYEERSKKLNQISNRFVFLKILIITRPSTRNARKKWREYQNFNQPQSKKNSIKYGLITRSSALSDQGEYIETIAETKPTACR